MSRILPIVVCVFVIFIGLQRRPLLAASVATQEPAGLPTENDDKGNPLEDNDNKTKTTEQSKIEEKLYNFKRELQKSPLKFGISHDNKGAQIRLESQF